MHVFRPWRKLFPLSKGVQTRSRRGTVIARRSHTTLHIVLFDWRRLIVPPLSAAVPRATHDAKEASISAIPYRSCSNQDNFASPISRYARKFVRCERACTMSPFLPGAAAVKSRITAAAWNHGCPLQPAPISSRFQPARRAADSADHVPAFYSPISRTSFLSYAKGASSVRLFCAYRTPIAWPTSRKILLRFYSRNFVSCERKWYGGEGGNIDYVLNQFVLRCRVFYCEKTARQILKNLKRNLPRRYKWHEICRVSVDFISPGEGKNRVE